jgi:hypothetical protein
VQILEHRLRRLDAAHTRRAVVEYAAVHDDGSRDPRIVRDR